MDAMFLQVASDRAQEPTARELTLYLDHGGITRLVVKEERISTT